MTIGMGSTDIEKKAIDEDLRVDESKITNLRDRFLQLVDDENLDVSEVGPVCEKSSSFVQRCLAASYNDENKAYKLGAESLRWRSKFKPSKITLDDFPKAAAQKAHAFGALATNGNPVLFIRLKFWNPWEYSTEEHYKMLAYIMETCQKVQNPADAKCRAYMICDMNGMSKWKTDLGKIAALAKVSSVYYPESCIGVALNADFLTQMLWKILSPLIDKRTRERVSIFRPGHFEEFLEREIGMKDVGPALGGSRAEEWPAISTSAIETYLANHGWDVQAGL